MFNNIGGKIKSLATFFYVVGILVSIVCGFIVMANAADDIGLLVGILIGLSSIALGCLISWCSSFLLYGFGQLVENSDIIARRLQNDPPATQSAHENIAQEDEQDA